MRKVLSLAPVLWLICLAGHAKAASDDTTPYSGSAAAPPPILQSDTNALRVAGDEAASVWAAVGGSAWSGDYGGPHATNIDAALLSTRVELRGLRLSATLPWMRISSTGAAFTGIDATPIIVIPASAPGIRVHEGLGDLTLGASYLFPTQSRFGVDIELSGRVKAPTGDHSVSTGKADYSASTEFSRVIGPVVPFVSVTYRDFGSPAGYTLRDGWAASAGVSYVLPHGVVLQGSYDYAQSASCLLNDSQEIVGSASIRIPHSHARFTTYASAGLSSGAAGVSGGLSIAADF